MKLLRALRTGPPELCGFFPPSKLCAILWRIMGQKCLIMRIVHEKIFNLLSFQIFVGFTFSTKLSIFKAKTRERKLFCRQINRGRRLFSLPACDWLRFFQSWRVLHKRTSAQLPTASSFFQRSDGYLLGKCTIFTWKNIPMPLSTLEINIA
mgnify:CR=1 FL=1